MGAEAPGEVFGRYRLLEVLPWGGAGTVYRAHDTILSREVAVRVLAEESADEPGRHRRIRDEVALAAGLNNPNIFPVYEVDEIDGRLYLAMPVLDGIDVQSLLRRDGPMRPRLAVRVIEQAAAALDAAHHAGLVHSDVQPSNLFVVGGELVYLLDVGLAAHAVASSSAAADVASGSWPYRAPERFGPGPADPRGDIYALACVLYECLTGQQAVKGDSPEQFATAHAAGEAPKATDVDIAIPIGFDEVIARGMAKKPEDRYQSARELAFATRDALSSPVAAAAVPVIEVEFGRYRLFELLGQGTMGSVYRAHDTALSRDVAVKVLRPELATEPGYEERFRREAAAAARLTSPNIIPIYEAGEIDGRLYLVMPLIHGVDVHTVLSRDGQMSPRRAVRVVEQAAAALDAAHQAGLVHRDVKSSNLLTVGDEFVYLIDFGLVHEAVATRLTRTNVNPGTPAYMAPERFKLETVADARGDVYSLACVLYECLTGRVPFAGGGVEGLAAAHLFSEPPRPCSVDPAIPAGFDEVIARGMAKDLDHRYQTANELAVAARAALSADSGTALPRPAAGTAIASPPGPPKPLPSPRRPRRAVAIAAALVSVVAVVAVAAFPGLTNHFGFGSEHARGQIVLPFTGLNGPAGIAVDAKGAVYVVDSGNNRVLKLAAGSSSQSSQSVVFIAGLDHPDDIAVDDAGDIEVTEPGHHRVLELTAGSSSPIVLPFTDLVAPTGVAVNSRDPRADRAIFVTDAVHNRVLELLAHSAEQTELPFRGLEGPSAVAVGGDRAVFVIDRENERVLKLPRTATVDTVLPYVIGRPDWVAVGADGKVYVTDSHGNRVVQLVKESSTAITLPFNGLDNPQGVAVDTAGNVYVADAGNNRVLKLPPS